MGLTREGRHVGLLLLISSLLALSGFEPRVQGSEFPERECCDPVYPIPAPGSGSTLSAGHGANPPAPAAFPEYAPPTPSSSVTTEIPGMPLKWFKRILTIESNYDFRPSFPCHLNNKSMISAASTVCTYLSVLSIYIFLFI